MEHIICFEAGPFNSLVVHLTGGKTYSVVEIPPKIMVTVPQVAAEVVAPIEPVEAPKPTKVKLPLSES